MNLIHTTIKMKKSFINFEKEVIKKGYPLLENVSLKEYTSLKIGGNAKFLVEPKSKEEIIFLLNCAKKYNVPFFIIGNGTNVLAKDEGYNGLIIVTKSNFNTIKVEGNIISALSGVSLIDLCDVAYESSLSGMEQLYGIPGSVGGAIYMNAGAFNKEIKDVIIECTIVDDKGNIKTINKEKMMLSYRHSVFTNTKDVILEAKFKLESKDSNSIKKLMDEILFKRVDKQPLEYPNAGSTFKRPVGYFASALIEESNLKGYKHHGVMVSDKHSGFLVNYNNGSSAEFLELIEIVKDKVKSDSGVELECEIEVVE
ncbi:MAG: UDP-N-acetylmuramate dehydrogenase [Anaerorhabdus sp.]